MGTLTFGVCLVLRMKAVCEYVSLYYKEFPLPVYFAALGSMGLKKAALTSQKRPPANWGGALCRGS
eukprot:1926067-Amphidinium_carterae.1